MLVRTHSPKRALAPAVLLIKLLVVVIRVYGVNARSARAGAGAKRKWRAAAGHLWRRRRGESNGAARAANGGGDGAKPALAFLRKAQWRGASSSGGSGREWRARKAVAAAAVVSVIDEKLRPRERRRGRRGWRGGRLDGKRNGRWARRDRLRACRRGHRRGRRRNCERRGPRRGRRRPREGGGR